MPDACPRCGARIAASRVAGEFAGACPRCLLASALEPSTLQPGTRVREFEILEPIGRGGMGDVYRARQPSLGRVVALKILRPRGGDFIARFEREARLLAALSHPNLVHVYDVGLDGDVHFLAMEHVDGRPLSFPAPNLIRVVRDVALALQKVHDAGLVHRDVKPSNILIAADGTPKLSDFGIALEATADTRFTETGVFVGSPHYASPEHIEGRALDGRSDLYALGVILFEGIAGRPPFTGPTSAAVLAQHLHEPPPLRDLDARPALRKLVERLLAKKPEDRPARAADVAAELDALPPDVPRPRRRGLLIGAGAAALAAALPFALRRPPVVPVDLLKLPNLDRDTVWGEWSFQDGALRVEAGRRAYRVQIPYAVPEEYDLTLRVERLGGQESFHIGMSNGQRNWTLMLDSMAGASGLHLIDGRMGTENETTRFGRQLPPNAPVDIEVKVRRGGVAAKIGGRPLVDWTGDLSRLSLAKSAFRVPSLRTIFLGAEMDAFKVSRLELRPLGSAGVPLAVPAPSDPNLLRAVTLERDAIWGQWSRDKDALVCAGGARAYRLQIPYEMPPEYDYRIKLRRRSDGNSVHIGLSAEGRSFAILLDAGGSKVGLSGLHMIGNQPAWQNPTTVGRPLLPPDAWVTVEVSVRKGRISAKADGTSFLDWSGPASSLGADPNFKVVNPRVPWLGSEVDVVEFAEAVVTPVSGAGRFLP